MLNLIMTTILFGGALSLFLALTQLVARTRTVRHYLIAFLLIFLGIFQMKSYLILKGAPLRHPASLLFSLPVFLSIGPLLYFNFQMLLDSGFKITPGKILHFLPAFFFLILELIFLFLMPLESSMELRKKTFAEIFSHGHSHTTQLVRFVIEGAVLYNIFYQGAIIRNTLHLYRFREMDLLKKSLFLVIIVAILSTVSFFILIVTGEKLFLTGGILIISFLIMYTYLIFQRELDLLNLLTIDLRRKKYERSLLKGLDVDLIRRRLVELMEGEKLYTDSDITLPKLADSLLITRHQLSQFLNEKLNMNFNTFINKYRIDEAKDLLCSDSDLSVLQIAYSVGFNSKSAFNTAFQKFSGTTPADFRKKEKYE